MAWLRVETVSVECARHRLFCGRFTTWESGHCMVRYYILQADFRSVVGARGFEPLAFRV